MMALMRYYPKIDLTLLFLPLLIVSTARGGLLDRVGAMGDSLTDEYREFFGEDSTFSVWTEHLARSRGINFGSWGQYPGDPARGYSSYQYNYAQIGARTDTLLSQGQHTGLASENVTLAFLMIGANDINQHRDAIYGGADHTPYISAMVANFRTVVETVAGPLEHPTGTKMVIGNVPDLAWTPISIDEGYTDPTGNERVRDATNDYNRQIAAIAADYGFGFFDLFSLLDQIMTADSLTVGGEQIILGRNPGGTAAFDQHYFWSFDNFHPQTVAHGLIANEFLAILNESHGTNVPLLTDQEILASAGIPEPGAVGLLLIGVLILQTRPFPTLAL
jgi:lysophospholipase L1-like esterase